MDVDDAVGEAARGTPRVEQLHVAGEHDQLDAALLEPVGHRRVARGAVGESSPREHARRDARRARRARSAGAPGCSEPTATISTVAAVDGVEQRLQVGARARDEDADAHAATLRGTASFGKRPPVEAQPALRRSARRRAPSTSSARRWAKCRRRAARRRSACAITFERPPRRISTARVRPTAGCALRRRRGSPRRGRRRRRRAAARGAAPAAPRAARRADAGA